MRKRTNSRDTRAGFTLVELLVAMSIAVILAGIAATLLPRFGEQERAARGADSLQRWLLIARQRAVADRVPTGIQFVSDTKEPGFVSECFYIQQPEDFTGGRFVGFSVGFSNFSFAANETDFSGVSSAYTIDAPVRVGDYLELYDGFLTRIDNVAGATQLQTSVATPQLPTGSPGTANYRIIRQPRRLKGESDLVMPQNIGIDKNLSGIDRDKVLVPANYMFPFQVLFAPSGAVVGQGVTGDKIVFYVRDYTRDYITQGGPSLIVINVRTGMIAAHPVDETLNGDLYSFTKDARSSGM